MIAKPRSGNLWKQAALLPAAACACLAQPIPFAANGGLKMLYDNRMYPQAVERGGAVHMVWRGAEGLPWIRSYDSASGEFSDPYMLLTGRLDQVDADKYRRDHHFAPIVWVDGRGRLHTLFGCHRTPGLHLIAKQPGGIAEWTLGPPIFENLSYPKAHRIYGGKTLIYFRHWGHLGSWKYRIGEDGGEKWSGPPTALIDMSAPPQDGFMAAHAGSYSTSRVSRDGKTLHAAFIWKMEEEHANARYGRVLHDHRRRHNLYYLKVDLPTGRVSNIDGKRLPTPVNKGVADRDCLVWDTQERVAAVGPSIYLDEDDRPYFTLPVSGGTPYRGKFYFVRREAGRWAKTPIAPAPHPFNSSHLERGADGVFRAFLITGGGESIAAADTRSVYGWGGAVEEWLSSDGGAAWRRGRDLTPAPGRRYQNMQFVETAGGGMARGRLMFYGWQGGDGEGTAYFWDERADD